MIKVSEPNDTKQNETFMQAQDRFHHFANKKRLGKWVHCLAKREPKVGGKNIRSEGNWS